MPRSGVRHSTAWHACVRRLSSMLIPTQELIYAEPLAQDELVLAARIYRVLRKGPKHISDSIQRPPIASGSAPATPLTHAVHTVVSRHKMRSSIELAMARAARETGTPLSDRQCRKIASHFRRWGHLSLKDIRQHELAMARAREPRGQLIGDWAHSRTRVGQAYQFAPGSEPISVERLRQLIGRMPQPERRLLLEMMAVKFARRPNGTGYWEFEPSSSLPRNIVRRESDAAPLKIVEGYGRHVRACLRLARVLSEEFSTS